MFSLQPLKEKFSKDTETTISLDFVDDYGRMKRRGAGCDILPPIGPLQGTTGILGIGTSETLLSLCFPTKS